MSNIRVETYIKLGEQFVSLDYFLNNPKAKASGEGAIEFSIDGKMISNTEYWDDIGDLWAYLVHGLLELKNGRGFETCWPDQPIRLAVSPLPRDMVSVQRTGTSDPDVSVRVNGQELLTALVMAALKFYKYYDTYASHSFGRELNELKSWCRL